MIPTNRRLLTLLIASLSTGSIGTIAHAQDSGADLEEIIITGSRARPRTVSDSPVPVDVFNTETIEEVAFTDTNDVIKTLVPSF
ncbi:MAG: hypothetical protein KDI25_12410, partial [Pseudomonadales bacterium]|nr:hypothetical protein [Pseudomonadales bacterium]